MTLDSESVRVNIVKAKATTETSEVNRLHEMEVQEVSLVDRPANKRAYAIIKRAGGGTMPTDTDAKPSTNPVPTCKADEGTVEDVRKPYPNEHAARMADPKDFLPGSFKRKKIADGIDAIFGQEEKDGPMVLQAYRFAKDSFTPAEAKAWLKEHDAKPIEFEDAGEPDAPFKADAPAPEPSATPDTAAEPVAKVGAKMRKERLARLREVYGAIGKLIAELEPEVDDPAPTAGGATKSENAPPPAGTPAPAAAPPPVAPQAAPAAPQAPAPPAADPGAVLKAVGSLAENVGRLTSVVKDQQSELDRLLRRTPASAALEVDGSREETAKRGTGYPWPMDMAAESSAGADRR